MKYMVITSVTGKYQIIVSFQAPQEDQPQYCNYSLTPGMTADQADI